MHKTSKEHLERWEDKGKFVRNSGRKGQDSSGIPCDAPPKRRKRPRTLPSIKPEKATQVRSFFCGIEQKSCHHHQANPTPLTRGSMNIEDTLSSSLSHWPETPLLMPGDTRRLGAQGKGILP